MNNSHPLYPNPTIQEAVCAVEFILPEVVPFNQSAYSQIYKHLDKDEFTLEPAMQIGFELNVGNSGVA